MKCFYVFVVIIGLALGNISESSRNMVSPSPNCLDELWVEELKQQYGICSPDDFHMPQILDVITQYRSHTINDTSFSQYIAKYCSTMTKVVSCCREKATIVSTIGRDSGRIQFYTNFIRLIDRASDALCSELIIYENASDKGFSCLDASELFDCVLQRRLSNDDGRHSLEDKNVCGTARRLQTCTDAIFDECQNDGIIKKNVGFLVEDLVQDFSCE